VNKSIYFISDKYCSIDSICRLIKNDTGRAILRVISGPKAFRVVLFTRLTPIPFGVQNVIFGVSGPEAGLTRLQLLKVLMEVILYLTTSLISLNIGIRYHSMSLKFFSNAKIP